MKTKEEQLKIYSAYLPYELELNIENEIETEYTMFLGEMDSIKPGIVILLGITKETSYMPECLLYTRNDGEADGYIQINNAKPILYPLDMLTQEIEYEGEKFIPTVWLRDNCGSFDISRQDMETLISMFLHIFRSPFSAPYYFIDKLLEWHFNVFGLEEDEFINKATLKK